MRTLAPLLISALLAACASTPTPLAKAKPVPSARVHWTAAPPAAGAGTLTVIVDEGLEGGAWSFAVSLDGVQVATMEPAETVTIPTPPGEHQITVARLNTFAGGKPLTSEFIASAGKPITYRIGIGYVAGSPVLSLNRDMMATAAR